MSTTTTQTSDLRDRVQSALDDGQDRLAFELLRVHAVETVDVDLLNDMAVIAHATGETGRAIHLLHTATIIDPDRADIAQNLGILDDNAGEAAIANGVPPLVPHMSDAELALLRAVGAHRMSIVEFGCGGSTAEWLRHRAERIVSVESDPEWVAHMREHPDLVDAVASGRLTLLHADVGPTGPWGTPMERQHIDRWPGYWSAVWQSTAIDAPADLVFVDGRFRVACALNAALHVGPEAVIVIHDFWNRDHYHPVLRHLDVVASADSLVVLRRRADIEPARVVDDIARHALDVR